MRREEIIEVLERHEPFELPVGNAREAAVLVPFRGSRDVEIILTRRTETPGDPHSGQVSFPGGHREEDDNGRQAAALRETEEELGIPRERVEVVGRLDDMLTITGFHVVPIVGWVPSDVALVANPAEVAKVFTVPLAELLREDRWERRVHAWRGSEVQVWHFPHDGEDVWGATAFMLRGLVEILRREPV